MKAALALAGIAVLVMVVYSILVLMLQRSAMYPAPGASADRPAPSPGESWLTLTGGVEAYYIEPSAEDGFVLVFAHGNGELVDHWIGEFEALRRTGHGAMLVEYPGYGRSLGRPNERSIGRTMVAAYDALVERNIAPERVVGYGRSLGGGAVCSLARERSLAALILESTFTDTPSLAIRAGALPFLVLDRFENLSEVAERRQPTLVLHGERDQIIPVSHGEALAAAAGVPLQRMSCGHNDCARPWPAVLHFLENLELVDKSR